MVHSPSWCRANQHFLWQAEVAAPCDCLLWGKRNLSLRSLSTMLACTKWNGSKLFPSNKTSNTHLISDQADTALCTSKLGHFPTVISVVIHYVWSSSQLPSPWSPSCWLSLSCTLTTFQLQVGLQTKKLFAQTAKAQHICIPAKTAQEHLVKSFFVFFSPLFSSFSSPSPYITLVCLSMHLYVALTTNAILTRPKASLALRGF